MSLAVAEIQQDLQKERRSRGGGSSNADFDEAEVCIVRVDGRKKLWFGGESEKQARRLCE